MEILTAKWATSAALAVIALLSPIHALLGAVGFLIFADMATGIAASIKKGERITSKAMGRTIYKALAYQLAVISGFAMEHLLLGDSIPVAKLVAAAIGLVEFKSLLENVQTLTGTSLRTVIERVTDAGRKGMD